MDLETFLTISFGFVCAIAGVAIGVKANKKQQTQERTLIMSRLSELSAKLATVVSAIALANETSTKVLGEVTKLREDFTKLSESLENVELPAEAEAALEAVEQGLAQLNNTLTAADAVNPDAEASGQ